MPGEGSMMLANALMKFNKREREHFIDTDNLERDKSRKPLIIKKAPQSMRHLAKSKLQKLQIAEQFRQHMLHVTIASLSIATIVGFCIYLVV